MSDSSWFAPDGSPIILRTPSTAVRRFAIAGLSAAALLGIAPAASAAATAAAGPGTDPGPGPATSAATSGRVCMFLAPDHIFGLGHVGWAFRDADGIRWEFGSTRSASASWRGAGTFGDALTAFRSAADGSGDYREYRCRNTVGHAAAAASKKADQAAAEEYDLLTDNCLTRSLEIFETYDDSGGLSSLGQGRMTAPRWYFDNDLDGFEGPVGM